MLGGNLDYWSVQWSKLSSAIRLQHLKEMTLEYGEDYRSVDTLPVRAVLGGVAPVIERLSIRRRCSYTHVVGERFPFGNPPAGFLRTLENLQELVLDYNYVGEWTEYVFAQYCKGLKALTYTRGDVDTSASQWQAEYIHGYEYLMSHWNDGTVISSRIDFSLKSIESLESLTISQDAIIVGKSQSSIPDNTSILENTSIDDNTRILNYTILDNFFPLSLHTLRIVDFNRDLYEAIQRFAGKLKSEGYRDLELVELVPGTWDPEKILVENEENLIMALFATVEVKCAFIKG